MPRYIAPLFAREVARTSASGSETAVTTLPSAVYALARMRRAEPLLPQLRRSRELRSERRNAGADHENAGDPEKSERVAICGRWVSARVDMASAERDYAPDVGSESNCQFESKVAAVDLIGFDDDRVVRPVGQNRHERISLQQKAFSSTGPFHSCIVVSTGARSRGFDGGVSSESSEPRRTVFDA